MFKIDSPGATGENRFKKTPLPATQVSDEWLNAVQDELVNAIAAGIAVALDPNPDKENSGQLAAVLLQIVARFNPMKRALDEIVTNEEIGGASGLNYDAPEQVLVIIRLIIASAMAVTDHGGGQRTIAFGFGAWRIKMGRYSESLTGEVVRTISFAEEFESACWHVFCQDAINAANNNQDLRTQVIRPTITTAGFSVQLQSDHDDDMGLAGFDWFAIGH